MYYMMQFACRFMSRKSYKTPWSIIRTKKNISYSRKCLTFLFKVGEK